jgi:hypothetical protein
LSEREPNTWYRTTATSPPRKTPSRTTLGAAFAPLIARGLLLAGGGTTTILAWFFCGLCVISGVAFFLAPDRRSRA